MSFITVRYGDNERKIFNPCCSSQVLLESIRRQCTKEEEAVVDLSDSAGNVKHLHDNPQAYANIYLEGRETYWLIKRERLTEHDPIKYSLMIEHAETTCPELCSRLYNLSNPQVKTRIEFLSNWPNNPKKKSGKTPRGTGRSGRGASKGKR